MWIGTWCYQCHLRVAPYAEQVKFRGKTFHGSCFTQWRLAELKKQAERKKVKKP